VWLDLVTICNTSHTTHNTKNVVVNSVDTNLSGVGTGNGSAGKNQLKDSVIDSGEVTASRRLVFLRAKSEGVNVDTSVRSTGVVLVRLN
jgi:hypothetical protein